MCRMNGSLQWVWVCLAFAFSSFPCVIYTGMCVWDRECVYLLLVNSSAPPEAWSVGVLVNTLSTLPLLQVFSNHTVFWPLANPPSTCPSAPSLPDFLFFFFFYLLRLVPHLSPDCAGDYLFHSSYLFPCLLCSTLKDQLHKQLHNKPPHVCVSGSVLSFGVFLFSLIKPTSWFTKTCREAWMQKIYLLTLFDGL